MACLRTSGVTSRTPLLSSTRLSCMTVISSPLTVAMTCDALPLPCAPQAGERRNEHEADGADAE